MRAHSAASHEAAPLFVRAYVAASCNAALPADRPDLRLDCSSSAIAPQISSAVEALASTDAPGGALQPVRIITVSF